MTARWWAIQEYIVAGVVKPIVLTKSVLETIRTVKSDCTEATVTSGIDSKDTREVVAKCPKCGNNIYENKAAYSCSNQDCGCVLFKEDKYFKYLGKNLTKTIAQSLFAKKQALVKNIKSKKGSTYDSIIKVDFPGSIQTTRWSFQRRKAKNKILSIIV